MCVYVCEVYNLGVRRYITIRINDWHNVEVYIIYILHVGGISEV